MGFLPRNVLCPVRVDDEEHEALARDVLDVAVDAASAFDARITLLTVSPPAPPAPAIVDVTGRSATALAEVLRSRVAHVHRRMMDLEDLICARGVEVELLLLSEARSIADLILETARERGCDLIVLGDSGKHRVRHAVFGGVAERVAHRSTIPVLVVHPPPIDEPRVPVV